MLPARDCTLGPAIKCLTLALNFVILYDPIEREKEIESEDERE